MKGILSCPICLGLLILTLGLPGAASAASVNDVVKAFEDNKEYVQPIATLFGRPPITVGTSPPRCPRDSPSTWASP